MKTTNQFRNNRIGILFFLTVILFPFISNAQLNLDAAGNVGVNTTPSYKFHVNSTANGDWLSRFTNGTSNVYLANSLGNGIQVNTGNSSSTYYALQVFNATSIIASFRNDGLVGIGTSSPGALLDVKSGGTPHLYLSTSRSFSTSRNWGVAANWNTEGDFAIFESTTNTAAPSVTRISINYLGNVGIGTTSQGHLLTLGIDDAAKPLTSTWIVGSDRKIKKNIESYNHGLDLVRKVKLVSYQYNGLANTPEGTSGIGVIAQDFQKVFPGSVKPYTIRKDSTTSETFLGVNFHELFIANVGAVKQLDSIVFAQNTILKKMVDSLVTVSSDQNSKITDLQKQISNCCNNVIFEKALINSEANNIVGSNIGDSTINGTSISTPVLYQNVPNPFNQSTSIQYAIPTTTRNASIMVFDLTGKLKKTIPITTFGNAAITINGNELSPGMFVYSLLVDSKIIDTKRMILTQ